jgi:hypothetical protein
MALHQDNSVSLKVVRMLMVVFRVVPYGFVGGCKSFGGTYRLHLQGSSEISVTVYRPHGITT